MRRSDEFRGEGKAHDEYVRKRGLARIQIDTYATTWILVVGASLEQKIVRYTRSKEVKERVHTRSEANCESS